VGTVRCGPLFSFWSTSGDHPQKGFSIGGDDKLLENSQNRRKPDLTLGTCQNLANSFLGFDQIWLLKLFWVQFLHQFAAKREIKGWCVVVTAS
jgi:hypothetical protein